MYSRAANILIIAFILFLEYDEFPNDLKCPKLISQEKKPLDFPKQVLTADVQAAEFSGILV